MIYVTIAALAAVVLVALAGFAAIRFLLRTIDRKERRLEARDQQMFELVDRTMHVIGKSWKAPPETAEMRQQQKVQAERQRAIEQEWDGVVEMPEPGAAYGGLGLFEEELERTAPEPLMVDSRALDIGDVL